MSIRAIQIWFQFIKYFITGILLSCLSVVHGTGYHTGRHRQPGRASRYIHERTKSGIQG